LENLHVLLLVLFRKLRGVFQILAKEVAKTLQHKI